MTLFTSLVFWKQDKVQSRSLLGLGAVLSVFLSIMGGFGLVILTGKCNGGSADYCIEIGRLTLTL
jgi:hypothetical protein